MKSWQHTCAGAVAGFDVESRLPIMRALMAVPTMYSIVKVTRTMVAAIASAHGYSAPWKSTSHNGAFHMHARRHIMHAWCQSMLVPGRNEAMVLVPDGNRGSHCATSVMQKLA
jgi:hypothetical protein